MRHLIIGYGYCGYYLAKHLVTLKEKVHAVSWSALRQSIDSPLFSYTSCDVGKKPLDSAADTAPDVLYYMVPPPKHSGERDTILQFFLANLDTQALPKTFVYYSTSGVYGDHQGQWVNEESELNPQRDEAHRRLDAESQLTKFCKKNAVNLVILRVAGIYGPNRIGPISPETKVIPPIIKQSQAPITNQIFVRDLVAATFLLGKSAKGQEIYNMSDGAPQKFGYKNKLIATLLNLEPPKEIPLEQFEESASVMLKGFLAASKKVSAQKVIDHLATKWAGFTPLHEGLKQSLWGKD